jgi:hypothetical protein
MGDGADLGLQAKQRRLPAVNGAEGEGGTDEGEEKPAEVGGRMDLGCLDLGRLDLVYPSPRTVEQMREGLDLSHLPSPVEEMSRAGAGLLLAEKGRGAPVQERERETPRLEGTSGWLRAMQPRCGYREQCGTDAPDDTLSGIAFGC